MAVQMDKLDEAIISHPEGRLLKPERLEALSTVGTSRPTRGEATSQSFVKRTAQADSKLSRLYEAVENGLLPGSDASLKERVDELTRIPDQARADADRVVASIERIAPRITAASLQRFAAARRKLRDRECGYH